MPFEEGHDKATGRPKGSENKVTKESRALFTQIMAGEVEHVSGALKEVREDSKKDYLNILAKLFPFFMPKMVDVTSESRKLGLDLAKEQYKDDEDEK